MPHEISLIWREQLGTVFMGVQELAAAMAAHVLALRATANPPGTPRVGGDGRSAPATVLQPRDLDDA